MRVASYYPDPSRVSMRALGRLLNARLLLMLGLYVDDSEQGFPDIHKFFGVGGIVAPGDNWDRFSEDWAGVLGAHGAPYMHTTEWTHGIEAFKDWPKPQREALMQDLMRVLLALDGVVVAATTSANAWMNYPEPMRRTYRHPYFLCFQEAVHAAVLNCPVYEDHTLSTIFDRKPDHVGHVDTLWQAFKEQWPDGKSLGTCTPGNWRELMPLQAADVVAYEATLFCKHVGKAGDMPALRWPLKQLLKSDKMLKYLDGDDPDANAFYGSSSSETSSSEP